MLRAVDIVSHNKNEISNLFNVRSISVTEYCGFSTRQSSGLSLQNLYSPNWPTDSRSFFVVKGADSF
jgi:hypothetical protein